jgi:hypothetical protein
MNFLLGLAVSRCLGRRDGIDTGSQSHAWYWVSMAVVTPKPVVTVRHLSF